jgi:hypothetical protein
VTLEHADWVPVLAKVGSLCAFLLLMIKWMKTNRLVNKTTCLDIPVFEPHDINVI